jgi:hypothetical protein
VKRAAIAELSLLMTVSQVVLAQEGKGAMSIHARGTFTRESMAALHFNNWPQWMQVGQE